MKWKKSRLIIASTLGLLLTVAATSAFADNGKVHIKQGSIILPSNKVLTYWMDSSVSSYGFTGSVVNGIQQWDSKTTAFSVNQTSSSAADIKVFVGNKSLPANIVGRTTYWRTNSVGEQFEVSPTQVTNGDNYNYARVVLDFGWQDAADFSSQNRYKTSGHEIGHVFGMNHFEDAPAHSGNHWMKQGKIDLTAPTVTDLAHFNTKWGY